MEMLRQERFEQGIASSTFLNQKGLKRNELLRALRLRRHWTQREAAERLGVNRVTLASWESGDHWPGIFTLHQACQIYEAHSSELSALTLLQGSSANEDGKPSSPLEPEEITWNDIETHNGDFDTMELHFLTVRAQLAQMPQDDARKREIACSLDYMHYLILQSRSPEARRELRQLVIDPVSQGIITADPLLVARQRRLYAVAQENHFRGNRVAEKALLSVLELGDTVPVEERCRIKEELAYRSADLGNRETALRLSAEAYSDAEASNDSHLLAIGKRQQAATLIHTKEFSAAEKALNQFPTHTPLFAVQQQFTYAWLLQEAGAVLEAIAAYKSAAQAAKDNGMVGYARSFTKCATDLETKDNDSCH